MRAPGLVVASCCFEMVLVKDAGLAPAAASPASTLDSAAERESSKFSTDEPKGGLEPAVAAAAEAAAAVDDEDEEEGGTTPV